eukprot:TRINITY_DN7061_c0_g1_i2.p1 TRINITY_DN7061_c0_g1~~TRINITY_DN7061_c0_g1_i2.p1  ORF type:complete len:1093 (+),score=297.78 TRINITY_DN7061_c0_g1_i2:111-3281(+)
MPEIEQQDVGTVKMTTEQIKAKLGDTLLTGEDADVSVTDAELRNIRRIFEKHDQDGSDSIDLAELRSVMEALGATPSHNQLLDLVRQVRVEQPGAEGDPEDVHLNFSEFMHLVILYKEAIQFSFLSTDSGAQTRAQQNIARVNRSTLPLPDSTGRLLADCAIAVVTLYIVGSALIAAVRPVRDDNDHWLIDLAIASAVFLVDAVLSALTCRIHPVNGDLVQDPAECVKLYLQTPICWLDLMQLVPWELWPQVRWLRVLKFVKVVSVFRPRNPSGKVLIDERYVFIHYTLVYQLRIVIFFMTFVHAAACMFCFLQQDGNRGHFPYATALYWVVYTVSTVGYGDVDITTDELRYYAVGLFFSSMLLNGFVISEISAFLGRTDVEEEQRGKMREMVAALTAFGVPRALRAEILGFQWHTMRSNITSQNAELLQGLPDQIQNGLGLWVRMRFIQCVPLFRQSHAGCRIALAQSLHSVVAAPEEYIIVVDEIGSEMYFLGHGYVDVIRADGQVLVTLRQGAFFGETALLMAADKPSDEGAPRTASIKALSYCDLFRLEKTEFLSILRRFPRFREQIKQQMRKHERRVSKLEQAMEAKEKTRFLPTEFASQASSPCAQNESRCLSQTEVRRMSRSEEGNPLSVRGSSGTAQSQQEEPIAPSVAPFTRRMLTAGEAEPLSPRQTSANPAVLSPTNSRTVSPTLAHALPAAADGAPHNGQGALGQGAVAVLGRGGVKVLNDVQSDGLGSPANTLGRRQVHGSGGHPLEGIVRSSGVSSAASAGLTPEGLKGSARELPTTPLELPEGPAKTAGPAEGRQQSSHGDSPGMVPFHRAVGVPTALSRNSAKDQVDSSQRSSVLNVAPVSTPTARRPMRVYVPGTYAAGADPDGGFFNFTQGRANNIMRTKVHTGRPTSPRGLVGERSGSVFSADLAGIRDNWTTQGHQRRRSTAVYRSTSAVGIETAPIASVLRDVDMRLDMRTRPLTEMLRAVDAKVTSLCKDQAEIKETLAHMQALFGGQVKSPEMGDLLDLPDALQRGATGEMSATIAAENSPAHTPGEPGSVAQ